ncbi:hypothetical protein V8C86DRAFT_3099586 [Haematococcus lacustris]
MLLLLMLLLVVLLAVLLVLAILQLVVLEVVLVLVPVSLLEQRLSRGLKRAKVLIPDAIAIPVTSLTLQHQARSPQSSPDAQLNDRPHHVSARPPWRALALSTSSLIASLSIASGLVSDAAIATDLESHRAPVEVHRVAVGALQPLQSYLPAVLQARDKLVSLREVRPPA